MTILEWLEALPAMRIDVSIESIVFEPITDVNDNAPVITTPATQKVPENTTVVAALISTDADTVGTNPATFSITGGTDAALFAIVGGNLVFKSAKDFESDPQSYQVEVSAFDGVNTTTELITVNVTNVPGAIINGTNQNDIINATRTVAGQALPTNEEDTIYGGAGNDTVNASAGNDTVIGGPGRDIVNAGDGDDTIVAMIGDGSLDVYAGGAGIDTLDMSAITAPATINLALFLVSSRQTGLDGLTSIENVIGGSGNDTITGNGAANRLDGRGGNDIIHAGAGNDVIIGGAGNDTLNGGTGKDIFVFAAGFGNDKVLQFDANPDGGQDLLDISAFGITSADFAARVTIADVGADTLVTMDGNAAETIRLVGIGNTTAVTHADFVLLLS